MKEIVKSILLRMLPGRRVKFDDNFRMEPVSRIFGLDRGTPIDRYYIELFLKSNSSFIKGKVLEVGDSYYTGKYGSADIYTIDILHVNSDNKDATLIADLSKPDTLPENQFDCFICTQTLNFIYDFREATISSYKLLAPGGVFLGTVAGISQISQFDMARWGDYWRFTGLSVKVLFEEVFGRNNVEVITYGNLISCISLMQGIAVEELPQKSLLDYNDKDYQMLIGIKAVKQ